MLTRQELGSMTLQRLAYILPQAVEEETMVKEIFEQRAKASTYQTLTTIDVKLGWQEKIIQKHVDRKREGMAPENPAGLTPSEEANLDTAVITKEKELELQKIIDARNLKAKGMMSEPEVTSEVTASAPSAWIESEVTGTAEKGVIELEEGAELVLDTPAIKAKVRAKAKKK